MVDDDSILTEQQKEAFVDWINSKAKGHECPVCGQNDWTVGDRIVHALTGNAFVTGTVYPQVFLFCNNCAFVRYFMAIRTGVVKKMGADAESEEESDG